MTDEVEWYGLYASDNKYKKYVSAASFAHPAKMSFQLCNKIMTHLEELGILQPNDTVLDFMAGTARTGIISELHHHPFIGVELEDHFVKMIEQNKNVLKKQVQREPNWKILQGDSRKLSSLLSENGLVTLTSPPYGEMALSAQTSKNEIERRQSLGIAGAIKTEDGKYMTGNAKYLTNYSKNPDNIGNLEDKPISITSPPYEDQLNKNFTDPKFEGKGAWNVRNDYGQRAEQLGTLKSNSYLDAMLEVYKEAAKVVKAIATVTKNPTRDHKLRRLDLDTAMLLEKAGFRIIDYHRAILFEERKQPNLIGGTNKEVKGRLSFFKRVSHQKGNVVAQWEDIIIAIKDVPSRTIGVTSPPYGMGEGLGHSYPHPAKFIDEKGIHLRYGSKEGNIGNLKDV